MSAAETRTSIGRLGQDQTQPQNRLAHEGARWRQNLSYYSDRQRTTSILEAIWNYLHTEHQMTLVQ